MARDKFVYRGRDRTVEEVVRKSKQSGGAYDSYLQADVQMLKVKEGESTIRILPPTWSEKDDEKWGRGWDIGIWIHYEVGPDKATYLCLDKMRGERCPVCDARREGTDEERDALRPQWRALAWVINRDDEKAGPQVWSMPNTVFREINLRSVDKKHNTPIPIDDPDEGYDVIISRDGSGLKTKYSGIEIDRDPTPLHDNAKTEDKWIDYIVENPLPSILQFYEPEHIEAILFGKGRAAREDDEEKNGEERGSRRARPVRDRGGDRERDYLDDEKGKDEDPPFDPDKRTSRRAAAEDEEERPRRARGREVDVEDTRSRGRRGEVEEESPRRGRAREDEADKDPPRGARRRLDEDEKDPPRRRRDEEEDAQADVRSARRREEDDGEEDKPRTRARADEDERPRRRARDDDPPEEEPDAEEVVSEAKRKLDDLGRRRGRR